jgi:hypothetical protein
MRKTVTDAERIFLNFQDSRRGDEFGLAGPRNWPYQLTSMPARTIVKRAERPPFGGLTVRCSRTA